VRGGKRKSLAASRILPGRRLERWKEKKGGFGIIIMERWDPPEERISK